jgi:hypothetical protein
LILVKESNPLLREEAEELQNEASQIANIIAAGVITMKGKR